MFNLKDFYTDGEPSKETVEAVTEGWKTVTPEEIKKWDADVFSEHWYRIYEAIGKVITEEQFLAIIDNYNKYASEDRGEDKYLYEIFEGARLFEEVHKHIEDVDLEHGAEDCTIVFKTPFNTYYSQRRNGNYDWCYYNELVQVKPVTKEITVYEKI